MVGTIKTISRCLITKPGKTEYNRALKKALERYNAIPHSIFKQSPREIVLNQSRRETLEIRGMESQPRKKILNNEEIRKTNGVASKKRLKKGRVQHFQRGDRI